MASVFLGQKGPHGFASGGGIEYVIDGVHRMMIRSQTNNGGCYGSE